MTTPDSDPVCDLQSIASVQKQLFWRWLRPFASMIFVALPVAIAAALGLYWLLTWASLRSSAASLLVYVAGGAIAAFVICAVRIGPMLWLDLKIHRRLRDMARRIEAGEAVRASELRV